MDPFLRFGIHGPGVPTRYGAVWMSCPLYSQHLDMWSTVGDDVWEGSGCMWPCWRKYIPGGVIWGFKTPCHLQLIHLSACSSRWDPSASASAMCSPPRLPAMMMLGSYLSGNESPKETVPSISSWSQCSITVETGHISLFPGRNQGSI